MGEYPGMEFDMNMSPLSACDAFLYLTCRHSAISGGDGTPFFGHVLPYFRD